jgi:ribonuclease Y
MAQWITIIGIAAVFILILIFGLRLFSLLSGRVSDAANQAQAGPANSFNPHLPGLIEAAEVESDATRQRAERETESLRRSVAAEVDALRRAAQAEADSARTNAESARAATEGIRRRGELEVAEILEDARRDAARELQSRRAEAEAADSELERRKLAFDRRESELDTSVAQLLAREQEHQSEAAELARQRAELHELTAQVERERQEFQAERTASLEVISAMTAEQAKAELLASVEAGAKRDAATLVRTIEAEARAEGAERARAIVVDSIQRVASEQTSETVVSVLHLPTDEMKGRIIGREGRNIRAFESVTGVNVIIDDTPEAVLLSCFDPVRREVGRITLEKLVLDGRIHPHRIEEIYETAKIDVEELCLRAAKDALAEVGITDIDPRLIPTIGRLKYRTSYGQNVLGHLIESAHIAGLMAAELGIEPTLIKRSAFLHDIGKALTHEVEGSHAIVGAELLRKYGESEAVAHAVEAHHNEVQPRTIEAVLTQASDSCSASRPGARRESLETYIKRLERIEAIASSKPGVERVFAMQAGREVRVMVQPNTVDDLAASVIAREVAKEIEDELTYPGQIRVTVVRETRATEVAH